MDEVCLEWPGLSAPAGQVLRVGGWGRQVRRGILGIQRAAQNQHQATSSSKKISAILSQFVIERVHAPFVHIAFWESPGREMPVACVGKFTAEQ